MIKKIFNYIKNIRNKKILFLIYLFLFSPIPITYISDNDSSILSSKISLNVFVVLITILSFLAIIAVYYYNFFVKKKMNQIAFSKSTHLFKIFFSYIYIICIFTNLIYMSQYGQNISMVNSDNKTFYFNFNKDNNSLYTDNIDLYVNSLYLSITTITTIGYGGVVPQHIYGKFLIAIEAMIGQIMWGLSITLWFVKQN